MLNPDYYHSNLLVLSAFAVCVSDSLSYPNFWRRRQYFFSSPTWLLPWHKSRGLLQDDGLFPPGLAVLSLDNAGHVIE
jgi:hypothetical protein